MIIKRVNATYTQSGIADVNLEVETSFPCEVDALCSSIGTDIDICGTCDFDCYDTDGYELAEPKFGGAFYDENNHLVYIEKVIYSKPAVIVIWSDGTKTRSTCAEGDTWNPDLGLTNCVIKKLMGQEFVNKMFRDWAIAPTDKQTIITLKEVRKKNKTK